MESTSIGSIGFIRSKALRIEVIANLILTSTSMRLYEASRC